jgi:hypothetical protein
MYDKFSIHAERITQPAVPTQFVDKMGALVFRDPGESAADYWTINRQSTSNQITVPKRFKILL